jgi:RimJ/RimL family protein N-acetyltransferase
MPPDIRLREVQEDDLPILYEHQRDELANRMAAFEPRDRDAFMEHWRRILRDPTVIARAVTADGDVAGNVVSFDAPSARLVGYWIGREHWGKGIATGALAAFLDEDPTRPLHALVAVRNPASIRVLEKCGFRPTDENLSSDDDVEEVVLRLN